MADKLLDKVKEYAAELEAAGRSPGYAYATAWARACKYHGELDEQAHCRRPGREYLTRKTNRRILGHLHRRCKNLPDAGYVMYWAARKAGVTTEGVVHKGHLVLLYGGEAFAPSLHAPEAIETAVAEGTPYTAAKPAAAIAAMADRVVGVERRSNPAEEEYRGSHRAPDAATGAPLHDLSQVYDDEVYGRNAVQYYGTGERYDAAAFALVKASRNKPDAQVTIYRAVPKAVKGGINPGDWVSIVRQYAVEHGEGPLQGDYRILTAVVPAKTLYTNGDSIHEWGYSPGRENPASFDEKLPELEAKIAKAFDPNDNVLRDTTLPDSPEFWAWFGNSKVVNKLGQPLVVYHGTTKPGFTEFAKDYLDDWHFGFFFTDSLPMAVSYSGTPADALGDATKMFENADEMLERLYEGDVKLDKSGFYAEASRLLYATKINSRFIEYLPDIILLWGGSVETAQWARIVIDSKDPEELAELLFRLTELPSGRAVAPTSERLEQWWQTALSQVGAVVTFGARVVTRDAFVGIIEGAFGRSVYDMNDPDAVNAMLYECNNIAEMFGNVGMSKRGVYRVYLSLQNPLIIDARGSNWDRIPSQSVYAVLNPEQVAVLGQRRDRPNIQDFQDKSYTNTDGVCEIALLLGYDSVIIRQCEDYGEFWPSTRQPADIFVAFSPTQIKSVNHNRGTFDPHDADIRNPAKVPAKYLGSLKGAQRQARAAEIVERRKPSNRSNAPFKTDAGQVTRRSSHARSFERVYGRAPADVADAARLTGIPEAVLDQVYARGMAAWQRGHRPGASQHAWALARVQSFATGGPTALGPDADLAAQVGKRRNPRQPAQVEWVAQYAQSHFDRPKVLGDEVRTHFNLNSGGYTIDTRTPKGWRMRDDSSLEVTMLGAAFEYQPAGHREYLASGRRNVHAWVYGRESHAPFNAADGWRQARYSKNPPCYIDMESGQCLPNDRSIDVHLGSRSNIDPATGKARPSPYKGGRAVKTLPTMWWRPRR